MNEREAFLRSICEQPEDDVRRLAFADWLQENARKVCWRCEGAGNVPVQWGKGDSDTINIECSSCNGTGEGEKSDGRRERAEFIRAQVEFSRLDQVDRTCPFIKEYSRPEPGPVPVERWKEGVCQCRGCVLARRERELLDALSMEAASGQLDKMTGRNYLLTPGYCLGSHCIEWRRGFMESLTLSAASFLKHARDLFAAHPVTEVRLTDVIPELHPRYDEPNGNPHIIIGVETDKDTLFGARVPMELFDLLPGAVVGYDDDFLWPHKEYPSFTHNITANEAISVACVAYGRSLVGLPPLAVPAAA